MTPDGTVSTIAGVPGKEGSQDGNAKEATFNYLLQILITTQSGEYQLMVLFQHLLGVLERKDMLMEREMMLVLVVHKDYV